MAELDEGELHIGSRVNRDGHLTHLFFAFHVAMQLFEAYLEVLLVRPEGLLESLGSVNGVSGPARARPLGDPDT